MSGNCKYNLVKISIIYAYQFFNDKKKQNRCT